MKLYYLRGAIGEADLLAEHQGVLERLLRGDYASSDLEKLQGHTVYSFRLNQAARLLFSVQNILGRRCLVVLDYLANHEYDKSRFLKSGVLKQYLERKIEAHEAAVAEALQFEAAEEGLDLGDDNLGEAGEAQVLDYHLGHWIVLNVNQHHILNVSLPALCSGSAGSGKSCGALTLLYEEALKTERELLYVTKSKPLAQEMQASFAELPLVDGAGQVVFKTFDELLQELEHLPPESLVGKDDFIEWYGSYIGKQKKVDKARGDKRVNIPAEVAYQECCVVSGYERKEYLGLSREQSQLDKESLERAWLYDVYVVYTDFLQKENKVDPAFYVWGAAARYSLIVVDEAQDFSNRQLLVLKSLAEAGRVIYFMDSHQQLGEVKSKRPFLLQRCGILPKSHVVLDKMYRCPLNVVAVANALIGLKVRCVGGLSDRQEFYHVDSAQETENMGHVSLFHKAEEITHNSWLMKQIGTPHCVIITEAEHLAEAQNLLANCPLILTPEQAKGLEYDVVIAYRLCRPPFLKTVQQRLHDLGDAPQPTHRPKGDANDDVVEEFNRLYTTCTRAKSVLVMCEPNLKANHPMAQSIAPMLSHAPLSDACLAGIIPKSWEDEVFRQERSGNHDVALLIFTSKLHRRPEDFDAFVKPPTPVVQASAAGKAVLAELAVPVLAAEHEPKDALSKDKELTEETKASVAVFKKKSSKKQVQSAKASAGKRVIVKCGVQH